MSATAPLPLYQCFKQVHAAKIARIQTTQTDGEYIHTLHFVDESIGNVNISNDAIRKHQPMDGWYYVVYPDGYESFSPAEAFEGGYARADNPDGGPSAIKAAILGRQHVESELAKLKAHLDVLETRHDELHREVNDEMNIRGRMCSLLTKIAEALYGPPPADEDVMYDWSQLPNRVKELRDAADASGNEFINAARWLMNPDESFSAELLEVFMQRGKDIKELGAKLLSAGRHPVFNTVEIEQ